MEVFKLFGSILIDNTAANNSLKKTDQTATDTGNRMVSTFKKLGAAVVAGFSIQKVKEFADECMDAYKVQVEAETKLETVMKQRMGSSKSSIQSVKDLTAAQQELGVVGDEVQMAGAQQLATFLKSDTSLKSLIPAMNDLAVQQNGVNVSSGNMVSIGNLMGKVMTGTTGALKKVGITFDESQEKVLKYGNEQERAAVLAQVITDNVGHMNQEIAKTDDGKQQQYKNTLGDLQEVIGGKLIPLQTAYYGVLATAGTYLVDNIVPILEVIFGYIGNLALKFSENKSMIDLLVGALEVLTAGFIAFKSAAVITSIISSFQQAQLTLALFSASQGGATIAQGLFNGSLTIGETLVALFTGKVTLAQLATEGWTAAQSALHAVMSANPIGIVVTAIVALIAILVVAYNKCDWFRNMVDSAFNSVKSAVGSAASFVKANIIDNIVGAVNTGVRKFEEFKSKAGQIFNQARNAITSPIQSAANFIKGIVGNIKGFFNFKISWPHIPLPHFNIQPNGWNVGDLLKGKIPSLGIKWFANAMNSPMVLENPTIFGAMNGQMLGAGEAGAEVVSGRDTLMKMINQASNSGKEDIVNALNRIIALLSDEDQIHDIIVKALTDGSFAVMLDGREVGRIARKYA